MYKLIISILFFTSLCLLSCQTKEQKYSGLEVRIQSIDTSEEAKLMDNEILHLVERGYISEFASPIVRILFLEKHKERPDLLNYKAVLDNLLNCYTDYYMKDPEEENAKVHKGLLDDIIRYSVIQAISFIKDESDTKALKDLAWQVIWDNMISKEAGWEVDHLILIKTKISTVDDYLMNTNQASEPAFAMAYYDYELTKGDVYMLGTQVLAAVEALEINYGDLGEPDSMFSVATDEALEKYKDIDYYQILGLK